MGGQSGRRQVTGFDPPLPPGSGNWFLLQPFTGRLRLMTRPAQTLQITVDISAAMCFRDDVVNGFASRTTPARKHN